MLTQHKKTKVDMKHSTKIDDTAAAWVAREDKGPLAATEQRERDAWLTADARHQGAYVRAQAVFLRAGRASALGHSFGQGGRLADDTRPAGNRRAWLSLATAAALALVAFGLHPLFTATDATEYRTRLGEVLRVPLQDGSVMTLNSGTRVQVSYSSGERRVVLLEGETLVNVAKDPERPFVVRTDSTEVVAVGTSFSVRRGEAEAFTVLVNEGVVDIVQNEPGFDLEPLRVRANYAVVAHRGTGVRIEPLPGTEIRRRLAWREGLISFEGDTLADAAMEFSRYSDVRILIEDPTVAERRVVGVYSSADPEGFAKAVASSLGLEAETTPEGVYLRASH